MENLEELMRSTMDEAHVMLNRAKTREEFMAINGSLLAVVQGMYVKFMGNQSTAQLFYSIADKLATTKD
jgi:hypothetical protein